MNLFRKIKNGIKKINPFSKSKSIKHKSIQNSPNNRSVYQLPIIKPIAKPNAEELYKQGLSLLSVNKDRALSCLETAAELNHALALYQLGKINEKGLSGVKVNFEKALDYYQRAAKFNNPFAQYKLGKFRQKGVGSVQCDEIEALTWYQKILSSSD